MKTKKDLLFAAYELFGGPVFAQRMKAGFIAEFLPAFGHCVQGLDDPVSEEEFRETVAGFKKEMPAYRQWVLTRQYPADVEKFWDERAKKTGLN